MSGTTTVIRNPHNGEEKTFTFDQSYWSHDGFKVNENGVNVPESEFTKYADQVRNYQMEKKLRKNQTLTS
jgi:hypothetical protein